MFSHEFFEIFKNMFFSEHFFLVLQAASGVFMDYLYTYLFISSPYGVLHILET